MRLSELEDRLRATGFPVKYNHFSNMPKPPYIVYLVPGSDNFSADDSVYFEVEEVQIELYTATKDLAAERKVKDALKVASLYFKQSETYVETEKLYLNIFETEILGE